LEILIDTTKRRENAYIFDDCLCHGSIGIAHMYNRIYSVANMDLFKEAAFYWYEKGIKSIYRQNCAAGIGFFGEGRKYVSNRSFLDGITGIGLSLISAIFDINPLWDECLLLS
jgi:lantibiotic modifying enzyme